MRKPYYLILAVLLLCSHDLYLKMETYFLSTGDTATLQLYNGTFDKSENTITRDRMLDASYTVNGTRTSITEDQWTDIDTTITQVSFEATQPGTYVAGVSTKARNIELSAEKFNSYLEHDGVLDMLEKRKTEQKLDQDAVESYQKHVKAIYQVGDTRTNDWQTVLGYPIEFVPMQNPYDIYSGGTLEVQLLLDGRPLTNQLVYANYVASGHSHDEAEQEHTHDGSTHSHNHEKEHNHDHDKAAQNHEHEHTHDGSTHSHNHEKEHSHDHDKAEQEHEHTHDGSTHSHKHEKEHSHDQKAKQESHTHTSGQQIRTDDMGMVTVDLPKDGIYYLRTIHMNEVQDNDSLTHQSKWATLTFEVTHEHGAATHTHDHDHVHNDEDGIPTWIFILGSILVIGLLFFLFKNKNNNA
ncbi:DUF4198 domain-containing protein [Nonlabens sp. SY33080]|uniref:DUF4198 domain-containing protein n=1 Tax=Nonlabens sp. SY33080 TaxID=2719911 RepID=UPI001428A63D|nr:DUF4198 domain-containing protein [Nonlabens sp. SY33080]